MKKLLSLVALLSLSACATSISQERLAKADYGPAPSKNYQETIKKHFAKTLIDPTSPLYTFKEPKKGYTKRSPMFKTNEDFGWVVCGTINSKNRMGGYTGKAPFFTLMKGNTISQSFIGDPLGDNFIINNGITDACNRQVP